MKTNLGSLIISAAALGVSVAIGVWVYRKVTNLTKKVEEKLKK